MLSFMDWAVGHPERIKDWGHRGNHFSTVASKAIIAAYYGSAPRYSYFTGCSHGGTQRTDSFLYPIISQMERAAGFTHDDDTQAKLNKLDACSRRASRRLRTQYCLLTCSRCRTTYVIRRSN